MFLVLEAIFLCRCRFAVAAVREMDLYFDLWVDFFLAIDVSIDRCHGGTIAKLAVRFCVSSFGYFDFVFVRVAVAVQFSSFFQHPSDCWRQNNRPPCRHETFLCALSWALSWVVASHTNEKDWNCL